MESCNILKFTSVWIAALVSLSVSNKSCKRKQFERRFAVSYHMVTAESLHDGGFVEELNPLAQAGRFIDCFDGYTCVRVSFDDVLGDSLIHHAEGALTQLSEHRDLVPGHLPLIRNIHYTKQTPL